MGPGVREGSRVVSHHPALMTSRFQTSMSEYDASSRYLAFPVVEENPTDIASRATTLRVTSVYAKPSWGVYAEPFLGLGFGDRYGRPEGGSRVPEGGEASPQIY